MNEHSGKILKIALIGNPNSGKSTVFNQLTGLRQKTGNFPGVTVDMKEGRLRFPSGFEATLIDLPGTYSLYPTSSDEKIVTTVLTNPKDGFYPDALVYVADVNHLEKHLLLFTQLRDLDLPIVLALNMADTAAEAGIKVNIARLAERLGVPVVSISGRTGENIQKFLFELEKLLKISASDWTGYAPFYPFREAEKQVVDAVQLNLGVDNPYRALIIAHHFPGCPSCKNRSAKPWLPSSRPKIFNRCARRWTRRSTASTASRPLCGRRSCNHPLSPPLLPTTSTPC